MSVFPYGTKKYNNTGEFAFDVVMPAQHVDPVTKSDTVDLTRGVCRGLWVGTAGSANLVMPDDTVAAAVPLVAGYNPFFVKRVNLGGTAANIWALY